ncbi:hypothetical protein O6H91_01G122600 [Diphasiastrum complanatum]|uniref:Uncharacterized protein n=1 Tax=Diphasiastrum complanatum TaxID=34168 RepID=A0ACC2EVV9_DIPCM|nr:hypothetical protein O6H91_01G122600 [Diphasiastrum complanatum]
MAMLCLSSAYSTFPSSRLAAAASASSSSAIHCFSSEKSWIITSMQQALMRQRRSCSQLSGNIVFVPNCGMLRNLRRGDAYKAGLSVRHSCSSSRISCSQAPQQHQDAGISFFDEFALEKIIAFDASTGKMLSLAILMVAEVLQAAEPAYAEATRFSPEQWGRIWILTGVILILYFFVIPLVIYNFLRLRWYKRSMPEALFQFMLVFIFFPGMLLLAPFINFRPLPPDSSKAP